MIAVGDPVGTGIVPSLRLPGGNITGLTSISPELDGKRLELLRKVVPSVSHVAVLWNSSSPLQVVAEKQTRAAADTLGMKMLSLGVRDTEDIERAFAVILRDRPQGLLVLADRLFLHNRQRMGAKPGDLPVERPASFELVVNLKTARAFGLTIPESVVLRATEILR